MTTDPNENKEINSIGNNRSNVPIVSIFNNANTTNNSNSPERQKRIAAFNNRKRVTNKLKKRRNKSNNTNNNKNKNKRNRNNKKKNEQTMNRRIDKKNSNYGFNNDITDKEENEIYNSLLKAVSIHNKLCDNELLKIFQNALFKLNAAWFRHNLHTFFSNNNDNNIDGDIISLILRLFVLNFDLNNTKHNVPFRYLLLDLIAPQLHNRNTSHQCANLIKPLPKITNFHKLNALQIFSQWILEITIKTQNYSNIYNNTNKNENKTDTTNTNQQQIKHKYKTLSFLEAKEIECLFSVFQLTNIIPINIRNKLCDKICDYLHNNNIIDAIEWTIYFNLIHNIPYNILLTPLLKRQSTLHYALNYIDSISPNSTQYISKIKYFIINTISNLTANNQTNIQTTRAIKLLERWNFDKKNFEPLMLSEIKNFLKWTIHKGHIDDYAILICNHNKILKTFIINQCRIHPTTYKSCIKWAKYWNLTHDESCKNVVEYCKLWLSKHNVFENENKNKDFIIGFHDLKYCDIDENKIIFVNDLETLNLARKILLDEKVDCIGLDLELMSVQLPIPNVPLHCQILQIATFDMAFIFDLQVLNALDGWDDLLTDIFCESEAVKVGMAWQGDLRNLKKQYPNCIAFKTVCTPYLELGIISNFMKNDEEFNEKVEECHRINNVKEKKIKSIYQKSKDKEGGLAKIVRWVLCEKLNKYEQLSNWSNRPLRIEQLKYAGLDAMVQCWLFRKFKEWEKETILPDLNGFYDDLYGQTD